MRRALFAAILALVTAPALPHGVKAATNPEVGPIVSVLDRAVLEGASGTTVMTFTLGIRFGFAGTKQVTVATANVTATSPSDYVAVPPTVLTFNSVGRALVSVTIKGDTLSEPTETFHLLLSNPVGVTLSDTVAVGTITNDDAGNQPVLSAPDVSAVEAQASPSAQVLLTFAPAPTSTVSVAFATRAGTATAGVDFVPKTGTVFMQAGQTTRQIVLSLVSDTIPEPDETFFVDFSNANGVAVPDATVQVTIVDNDLPKVSIADVSVTEGNSGTKTATFTATLSSPPVTQATVSFATQNITAQAGSDYVATNGTLTFAVGQTQKTFAVTINGDTTVESNESFEVILSNSTNLIVEDTRAAGTITNDDAAAGLRITAISNPSITEGNSGTKNLNFVLTFSGVAAGTETITISTANGTAAAGSDYVARTNVTLAIPAGNTQRTVSVVINGDTAAEANETLKLNIVSAVGLIIDDNQATGTITNDD